MGLKAGIVGLPNVGKSTLFNAITNSNVEAANYPFATINPNVGTVIVPDERVDNLSKLFNPKKFENPSFVSMPQVFAGVIHPKGLGCLVCMLACGRNTGLCGS